MLPSFFLTFFKIHDIIKEKGIKYTVWRKKKMSEQKYDKKQVWDDMIDEYFNRHPDAGLAWWQLPLEEQPEEFKVHMYDILWDLTHEEDSNK